jgi:diguanylate cyclase (GGDEF)-like protein
MDINLLIVDDDAAIRESMREFLEMVGYSALIAASAEDALEMVKRENIQIVISDIILPGMDGLDLTDIIKQQYDIDVIVMTGYSGDYSYEEAINKGASDFVFKPVRFEELLLRIKRVLKERRLTRERVLMLEKLQRLAITDGLTKLYNSRYFYNQLDLEVDRVKRYGHPLALLLLDIDHFKLYNDAHGHVEGDKVLVMISRIIQSCLRKNDTAYRYGGEEFAVLLPVTEASEASVVAERIRSNVEAQELYPATGSSATITISIGVTHYDPGERISTFVERADRAMYLSKKGGRNIVTTLTPETSQDSEDS